jgi:AraC family transcriptional regulator
MHQPPAIQLFRGTTFIGMRKSVTSNPRETIQLWRDFMPRRGELKALDEMPYSIDQYPHGFFDAFDAGASFHRMVALRCHANGPCPVGMEQLTVSDGLYAVFNYHGAASAAFAFFEWIYTKWLPTSDYLLDHRPHINPIGPEYLGEHPDSRESFWIPIKRK